MFVGTVVAVWTGTWVQWGEKLAHGSVWIETKVVFVPQERLKLEPLAGGVRVYHWIQL